MDVDNLHIQEILKRFDIELDMGEGRIEICEEGVVAFFLEYSIAFVSTQNDACCVLLSLSDVFWWATADGESFGYNDIADLWRTYKADQKWGLTKWVCRRRGMRPQWPMARDMIKDGAWDETMDALPLRTDGGDHGWGNKDAVAWLKGRA